MSSEVPPAAEAASSNSSAIDRLVKRQQENLEAANKANNEEDPSAPQAAVDLVGIITLITTVLQAFQNCRNGTANGIAEARSGSPRVRRLVRDRLIKEDYGNLRNYRQRGGARVLEATIRTFKQTSDAEWSAAINENYNDRVDSGYDFL
jgi:hypothetical protein